jgi:shikimate dehydrogenase
MKKYLVIGNPIEHSLSPKLHNFWLKKNNINAVYEKKNIHGDELNDLILEIRKKNINGINVTVPFKNKIIPHLDELSIEAKDTQSVNTIYLKEDKIIGHNTDIAGFELGIKNLNFDIKKKTILILGAGGVVPSIIFALNKMKISEIIISNRTKTNAENLKNMFKNIKIVDWGVIPNFDMIINATSVGLMKDDKIDIDFSEVKKGKFFMI